MAEFRGHIITNNGRNLLSRALAGAGKIIFTKAAFGDQKYNDNFKEVTALKNKKLDLNVMGVRNDNGTAILTVFITNQDVTETFLTQEFGIFAKIEGDESDILFAYTTAIVADAIPNNNFGTTYESVNDIYLAFSNDIEADILVKDGVIFLTRDIADQVYTKNEYPVASLLSTSSNLKAEHLYADNNGNWYLNIGGERNWDRNPTPDNNLIKLSFKTLYNFYKKISSLLTTKEEKEIVTLKTNGIVGGTLNPSFIQDSGTKIQGQYYLDRNTGKLFQCIQTTSSIVNSATFFKDVSLNEIVNRLENLFNLNQNNSMSVLKFSRVCIIFGKFQNINLNEQVTINLDITFKVANAVANLHHTGTEGIATVFADVNDNKLRLRVNEFNTYISKASGNFIIIGTV